MRAPFLFSLIVACCELKGLLSCPKPDPPPATTTLPPSLCPEMEPDGTLHPIGVEAIFERAHLQPLVQLPCIIQRDKDLEDIVSLVAAESIGKTVSEMNTVLSVVEDIVPGQKGVHSCFDEAVGQAKSFLPIFDMHQETLHLLLSYLQHLDDLKESALQHCDPQNKEASATLCRTFYSRDAKALYKMLSRDLGKIVPADDVSALFAIKSMCIIRFLVGAHVVRVANNFGDNEDIVNEFKEKLFEDTTHCVRHFAATVDVIFRLWSRSRTPSDLGLRMRLWKQYKPWMAAFKDFNRIKDVTSGPGPTLQNGGRVMLFDISAASTNWISCPEGVPCRYTACPGYGPAFNSSSQSQEWQSNCVSERFTIAAFGKPSGQQILVNEVVRLLNFKGFPVYWEIYDDTYQIQNDTCYAKYMRYNVDDGNKEGLSTSSYHIQAWDWSGRRREPDEPIYDRDYVAFSLNQVPDYKRLHQGRGMFYLEGVIFISP